MPIVRATMTMAEDMSRKTPVLPKSSRTTAIKKLVDMADKRLNE